MRIYTSSITQKDLIYQYLPANYREAFECNFSSEKNISADDIQVAFWTNSPQWIRSMFKLRDKIVKVFGIEPGNDDNKSAFAECIKSGNSYRFISIPNKSADETILCANDKHLVMYFSIKLTEKENNKKTVKASTIVKFHNLLGRAYFCVIFPFHYIIVHSMLKFTIKNIK